VNAEYSQSGKTTQFEVTPLDGQPPRTSKITERSTCGKGIIERILDVQREVAMYSVMGTEKKKV
jgi:hypothetical protein